MPKTLEELNVGTYENIHIVRTLDRLKRALSLDL